MDGSTVPSNSMQEKSPVPATTPLSPAASRASVSDQSETSDTRINRAQGQERDKSKHKFVYQSSGRRSILGTIHWRMSV